MADGSPDRASSRSSLQSQPPSPRIETELVSDDNSILEPGITEIHLDDEGAETRADETSDIDDAEARALLRAANRELDYYSMLGLTRDPPPSTAAIRSAHHRLSLAFHPDRHPDHLKSAAEENFTRLQMAYETLIHPHKRIIYDLEGADGVRDEYGVGGAMGRGGEAKRQLGVKTMTPEEFKKLFLGILKKRERKAIQALVDSTGRCAVILDATRLFCKERRELEVEVVTDLGVSRHHASRGIRPIGLDVGSSFRVGLSGISRSLRDAILLFRGIDESESNEEEQSTSWDQSSSENGPTLTIRSSVSGYISDKYHSDVSDPVDPYKFHVLTQPPLEAGVGEFEVGALISHTFPEETRSKLFKGVSVDLDTRLFPHRAISVGLGRSLQIFEGNRPSNVICTRFSNLGEGLAGIDLRISRALEDSQTVHIDCGTGSLRWPHVVKECLRHLNLTPLEDDKSFPYLNVGCGWVSPRSATNSDSNTSLEEVDDGAPSDTTTLLPYKHWYLSALADPFSARLTLTHNCDLFTTCSPKPRSRFTTSGTTISAPTLNPPLPVPRGIRLQTSTTLSLSGHFSYQITGLRRIGTFSHFEFGMRVAQGAGISLIFSWSRLGQKLSLPILFYPDAAKADVALLAVAVPWLSYFAVDWLIVRPSVQRQRKRLLSRKRREMGELVKKRRAEAGIAVELMREMVGRRQAGESERGGLLILEAKYGVKESAMGEEVRWAKGEVADVTIATAALVEGGQLVIPRGLHKSQITGFWDPAPLKRKVLVIRYLFKGGGRWGMCC